MSFLGAILLGCGIGLIFIVIHFMLNPKEWEKVNRDSELEMQRKKRRKKARRHDPDDEIIGLPWMTNWQREKQRERREWEHKKKEEDRYFRKFE